MLDTDPNPIDLEFTPQIPPELWKSIFVFATFTESRPWPSRTTIKRQLVTKRSLVLVCKLWHAIALPLLYQSVSIHDASTAQHFLRTLVDTANTEDTSAGYGKWVRDLIFPEESGSQDWRSFHIADLLNRCPHVRVVLKEADMNAGFWHRIACTTSCLACPSLNSFMSLRSVSWACSSNPGTISIDAQRLTTLLRHAPNLACLHVRHSAQTPFSIRLPSNNPLTKLHTLQYLTSTSPGPVPPLFLRRSDMPHLLHIVAGIAALTARDPIDEDEDHSSLLAVFGKQLEAVNLWRSAPSVSGGIARDIYPILRRCPNLRIVCFDVFPTVLQPESGVLHPSLTGIILRINDKEAIGDEELEQSLRAHVKTITGDAFPALRRVELAVFKRSARPFYPACRDLLKRFPSERVEGMITVWENPDLVS